MLEWDTKKTVEENKEKKNHYGFFKRAVCAIKALQEFAIFDEVWLESRIVKVIYDLVINKLMHFTAECRCIYSKQLGKRVVDNFTVYPVPMNPINCSKGHPSF